MTSARPCDDKAKQHLAGRIAAYPSLDLVRLNDFCMIPEEPVVVLDDSTAEPEFAT